MSEKFNLIPVATSTINHQETLTCDARELHTFLEVGRDFSTWLKERINKYGFTQDVDFTLFTNSGEKLGHRHPVTYTLTIDMAKQLAMVENNEKGLQVRRYFIECERRLKEGQAKNAAPARPQHKFRYQLVFEALEKLGGSSTIMNLSQATGMQPTQIYAALMRLHHKGQVSPADGQSPYNFSAVWRIGRFAPKQPQIKPSKTETFACPYATQPQPPFALNNIINDQERYDIHQRLDKLELARKELYVQLRDTVGLVSRRVMDVQKQVEKGENKALHWLPNLLDPQSSSRWNGFDSSMFSEIDLTMKRCEFTIKFLAAAQQNK